MKQSLSKMPKAASEEKPYAVNRKEPYSTAVSETAAYYQPQTSLAQPYITPHQPSSLPELCSIPKADAITTEPETTCISDNAEQKTIEQTGQQPAEKTVQSIRITVRRVNTAKEALLSDAPRYTEKCRRWKDIEELRYKEALIELLRQGKTPETVAAYLNCSKQQIYRAMKAHSIPTARAYVSAKLEHKLNLSGIKPRSD